MIVLLLALLTACAPPEEGSDPPASGPRWTEMQPLRLPVTNNAVAASQDCVLYSVGGMGPDLDAEDERVDGYRFVDGAWQQLPELPGEPRVATSAVVMSGRLHVIGGYSIEPDGAEVSRSDHHTWDPGAGQWGGQDFMPFAIDDAVVVVWNNRLIVVTGWSNTGNVADVWAFVGQTGAWEQWQPFPGRPVFGAAGALAGDTLVLIDGVADDNGFELIQQAWAGHLSVSGIEWEELPPAPGPARYRAAAGTLGEAALFAGGGARAYNYDGIAYSNGTAVAPVPGVIGWDGSWFEVDVPARDQPTMDHRALASCEDAVYSIGGMVAGPEATRDVFRLEL